MCKSQVMRSDDFSTSFYQASQLMTANQQNFASSPVSVLVLLSLLFSSRGPRGNTRTQICQVLTGTYTDCSDKMAKEIDQRLSKIASALDRASKQNSVKISNAAFVQKEFELLSSFKEAFRQHGANEVELTDFKTDKAFEDINEWVNKSTEGMIEKLYDSALDLSKDTVLVLLNTIYFKDKWQSSFFNDDTILGTFKTPTQSIEIHMMSKLERMLYYRNEDAGYHLIGKKFQDTRFKFVVVLPIKQFNLDAIETAMKNKFNWTVLNDRENTNDVKLTLPRFKVEHEMDLKGTLIVQGISDLFTRGQANLSGIDGTDLLYANDAKQKVVLEVNEHGVKAAAVTSISFAPRSGRIPKNPVIFTVDEPFFCAIYDTNLQMPLFLARVLYPTPLEN